MDVALSHRQFGTGQRCRPFVASLLGRVRGGRVHDGPIRAAATGVQVHRAAIDPLATKNMELPADLCRRVIADSGVDPVRPLLLQVSRFDPWKDPLGVVHAYRLVKEDLPAVQFVLIGAMAGDDPEGWKSLDRVEEEAANDPDLFVFTNLSGGGSMEVNAFQRSSDGVI